MLQMYTIAMATKKPLDWQLAPALGAKDDGRIRKRRSNGGMSFALVLMSLLSAGAAVAQIPRFELSAQAGASPDCWVKGSP